MSEISFARQRLSDALGDVLRLEAEERVRRAYEHGYNAGLRAAGLAADKATYRRGYLAGYSTGKRGRPCLVDGHPEGRPRVERAPTGPSYFSIKVAA